MEVQSVVQSQANNVEGVIQAPTKSTESVSSIIVTATFVLFVLGLVIGNIWLILKKKRPFCVCYPLCCCPVRIGCFGLFQGPANDGAACAPIWSNTVDVVVPAAQMIDNQDGSQQANRGMQQFDNSQNLNRYNQPQFDNSQNLNRYNQPQFHNSQNQNQYNQQQYGYSQDHNRSNQQQHGN